MIIGEIIKRRRLSQNLTQERLAEMLNVTPQAVSRWENEISYPDITLLPRISGVLRISADELLGIRESPNAEPREGEAALCQNDVDKIFGYTQSQDENGGRRVLLVDDADFLRKVVCDMLTSQGYAISGAAGAEEALHKLEKESFDVVLLDIAMPQMDGFEALKKIKELLPRLPVIMLSARSSEANVRKALDMGAAGFVAKPFNPEGLLEHIKNLNLK